LSHPQIQFQKAILYFLTIMD